MEYVASEDETEHWLSVPWIDEWLAKSEEDAAAGRTYGEAEVRAYLADMTTEMSAADADCWPKGPPSEG
jgi:hypothetical protein